ncbi:MAG: hypothetical protein DWP98_04010 [Bacteroidetes bacterium]|nr:MAG: hypothetical protein DWP98_04010 [Bacteroidota bacterium]MBL1143384.1 hypothetical protein [Bacteroidota bacterium]
MKMNKLLLLSILLLSVFGLKSQNNTWKEAVESKNAVLDVIFYENEPFSYFDKDKQLTGIEIDILNSFKKWMYQNKGVALNYNYIKSTSFQNTLTTIANGKTNSIGASTVSKTDQRARDYNFSAPYLKNISVLISHGDVPTLVSTNHFETTFSGLIPITIQGSIHETLLKEVVKACKSERTPEFADSPMKILELISDNPRYYGYVDILTYWKYIKNHPSNIKMHKKATIGNEFLGFIFPQNSDWNIPMNEFFESGFGFTSTKAYREILEKHLGYEVIDFVELD